jgi:hypothetical protein
MRFIVCSPLYADRGFWLPLIVWQFRAYVSGMTARMFHLRLMEYQQLLVLLADNNLVDLAMKLFVGIVQMEAFRSESTTVKSSS